MAVYLKDSNWFIDYRANGRRIREKIGTSKVLAETVLKKRKVAIAEGKFLDIKKEHKVKFEDFSDTYFQLHAKVNQRPLVIKRTAGLLNHLCMHFSGKSLAEITPQSIEQYKSERIKKVAPATVNKELACLKCLFNKAIAWGKFNDNPVRKVKLLKEDNKRIRYLEKEEIRRLIDNCASHLKPIVIVAVFTGMRKSEILELKWKNIDIERGIIYLLETKNGERREVIINNTVKRTLIAVLKHPFSPYVFCEEDGKPYANVRKSFFTALKKAGIINFHFHDLRHTFASQLVMSGVDLKTVQELLGHKSIEMTMRYSHLSPSHKKRAVEILDRQMDTFWTPEAQSTDIDNNLSLHNLLEDKLLVN